MTRASLIRAIFGEVRRRGLGEEDRHALQQRVVGKRSLTTMSDYELRQMLVHLRGGRGPATKQGDDLPDGPLGKKIIALWINGYHLGVIQDRRTPALCAWVRKWAGIEAARFATPAQLSRAIEGLREWLARDGGVEWRPYITLDGKKIDKPAARVMEAQWRILVTQRSWTLQDDVNRRTESVLPYHLRTNAEINRLIAEYGDSIRARLNAGQPAAE